MEKSLRALFPEEGHGVAAKQDRYDRIFEGVQEGIDALKKKYGSWQAIPKRERDAIAMNLRNKGFTYDQR